jgi:hypothetical protein
LLAAEVVFKLTVEFKSLVPFFSTSSLEIPFPTGIYDLRPAP